jgi:hypothetical protein
MEAHGCGKSADDTDTLKRQRVISIDMNSAEMPLVKAFLNRERAEFVADRVDRDQSNIR